MRSKTAAPTWFTAAAVVLLLWNLLGAYACIQQFRLGAEAMGPATEYDRQLYAGMPGWYDWCFALAELAGVGGALALVTKRAVAVPLFAVSLIAVVVQFGYLFLTRDIIAVKGIWTTYFPAFLAAVCILQVWLARDARRRGWIG
jgi:hypothetical protein